MKKLVSTGFIAGALIMSAGASQAQESFSCLMQPTATIKLGSSISGILDEVNVERGARVRKGDVVAKLASGLQEVELGIAKLRAESSYDEAAAVSRLKFQDAQVARVEELYTRKVVAEVRLDEQKTERQLASLAVNEAKLQMKLKNMDVQRSEELLALRHMESPVDGLVIDSAMQPGEFVHEQSVVVVIAALAPLVIEAYLPVEFYDRVKTGDTATIVPDAPVGGSYQARIKSVDQVFDAASGTFGVRLELPNSDFALPGGHRCQLNLDAR